MSFFYEEARNFYATNQYIVTLANIVINSAVNTANVEFAQNLLNTAATAGSTAALTTAITGSALTQPFGYSTWNLVPFDQIVVRPLVIHR